MYTPQVPYDTKSPDLISDHDLKKIITSNDIQKSKYRIQTQFIMKRVNQEWQSETFRVKHCNIHRFTYSMLEITF